jgi:cytochrome c nitrite reductase small subunit
MQVRLAVKLSALTLAILLGIFFGMGFYTFYFAKGYSYLYDDPTVCTNCHIMRAQFDGWQKSSHHAYATCNDCHTPHALIPKYYVKMENGYHHSRAFTFQNFHEPIQIRPKNKQVLLDNCLRCHGNLVSQLVSVESHHSQESMDCVRCHNGVGHGPRE